MEPRIALKFLRPVRNLHCAIIILANAQLGQVDGNLKWELGGGGLTPNQVNAKKGNTEARRERAWAWTSAALASPWHCGSSPEPCDGN